MWELFIWTKNIGSNGNGIVNSTQESQHGICSVKPFELVLIGKSHFMDHLAKLKKMGIVIDYIMTF